MGASLHQPLPVMITPRNACGHSACGSGHLHIVYGIADNDCPAGFYSHFRAGFKHHGGMRLRRTIIGGSGHGEIMPDTMALKNRTHAAPGFARHKAEQKVIAPAKLGQKRQDTLIERGSLKSAACRMVTKFSL
ncbi:hypothetical protein C071_00965 [Brucella abortus F2/06-8]|nr:hypothetical protein C071_00965 [Brucella abortus F2/06-8]